MLANGHVHNPVRGQARSYKDTLVSRSDLTGSRTGVSSTHYLPGGASMGQWLDDIRWNADGLIPAIAQDAVSGDVLMLAWMSRESLARTLHEGEAVYWSRSRECLWKKGEQSGHLQRVTDIRLDCDGDTVLLKIQQVGGIACHTGRRSCFYQALRDGHWESVEPVLEAPETIYKGK